MTKIDIFSGFLGAGKTTLIKKLISEAYKGQKIVLIENEFGEIGVDGGFLQNAGVEITEINSGCICCSLVGDFSAALKQVVDEYSPDRVIIEPSGVGKLTDVVKAVKSVDNDNIVVNGLVTVVDANKCKIYVKNFGEFFNNQIETAKTIILSHNDNISDEKLKKCVEIIREHNKAASLITTAWDKLDGKEILEVIENAHTIEDDIKELEHHHHEGEECHCHEHNHEHHHHHNGEECHCHDHDHEHHHHHHADDVFSSWGKETVNKYSVDSLKEILGKLTDAVTYGTVLRAKGIVEGDNGSWLYFDYIPNEIDIREGKATTVGKVCVIGAGLDNDELGELFGM